jgi:hypothetical protein
MKQYIVIEYQTGGCDYTIGCGYRITTFEAQNWEDAVNTVLTKEGEDYPGNYLLNERKWKPKQYIISCFERENGASHVMLVEVSCSMQLDDLILKRLGDVAKAKEKEKEDAERKEFERLKKKFEK